MKNLDAYHIDPAVADVVMEMIENLRIRLAASEARERRLCEAVLAALDWLGRFGEHAPIMFGGEAELHEQLTAALDKETNDDTIP